VFDENGDLTDIGVWTSGMIARRYGRLGLLTCSSTPIHRDKTAMMEQIFQNGLRSKASDLAGRPEAISRACYPESIHELVLFAT